MAITEARQRANRKWNEANLERIYITVRAGEKEKIKAAADAAGESVNHYIVQAARERMEREEAQRGS